MTPIYRATAEALIAATQLGAESGTSPPPARLREDLLGLLQQMVSRCRAAGIADADTAEARYAIVAFIDERILKSNYPGRGEWMNNPLQLQLYREYTAGENFFARLRALLHRPQYTVALEVYYLCLSLGFTGASSSERDCQSFLEAIRVRLPPVGNGAISPHAVPTDSYSFTEPRRPVLLGLAIACALVVAMGLGLLDWSMGRNLRRTQSEMTTEAARTNAPSTAR